MKGVEIALPKYVHFDVIRSTLRVLDTLGTQDAKNYPL